ncbi:MAG TPA: carboxypeptidase-like regulatory domain-containing protein [Gemmatimonadales bacterium]|nr:carboxypeptidase-like regulatory domain-containing protein [Gemmatimonadales bacterium]
MYAGLALAALTGWVPALSAQAVGGTVTAGQTGAPVGGAVVLLLDAAGREVARGQSDGQGRYRITAPEPGRYRVRFLVPGYRPLASQPLDLVRGALVDYPLSLTAVPPALLDTLIVEGRAIPAHLSSFYRRRERGHGRFLTRDDIEQTAAPDVTGLVRRLNVFDILSDRGDGRGARIGQRPRGPGQFCPAAIYMNGNYAGLSGDVDVDMLVTLDGTEAMEVYRSSEVPQELESARPSVRGVGSRGCGVVSLWSRVSPRDTTRTVRHLALGGQAGARLGSGGIREGRIGISFSYTLTRGVEFYPALNLYGRVPHSSGNPVASGIQAVLALRIRPLGGDSPWYLGTGTTVVDVTQAAGRFESEVSGIEGHHHLLLTGVHLSGGAWRPYVEIYLINPLQVTGTHTSLFAGLAHRFY